jgi:hypothetical protein
MWAQIDLLQMRKSHNAPKKSDFSKAKAKPGQSEL